MYPTTSSANTPPTCAASGRTRITGTPLAWSKELKAGEPYAASFAGDPVVLVRPKDGPVFALEDRCAHRQVPLSKGLVNGCAIRCGYHGWTYDASGKCVDVPYLGKGKLPNGVRAYPCREQDGLVFIWPGDPANVTELGPLGAAADPAFKTRRRKAGRHQHCQQPQWQSRLEAQRRDRVLHHCPSRSRIAGTCTWSPL